MSTAAIHPAISIASFKIHPLAFLNETNTNARFAARGSSLACAHETHRCNRSCCRSVFRRRDSRIDDLAPGFEPWNAYGLRAVFACEFRSEVTYAVSRD